MFNEVNRKWASENYRTPYTTLSTYKKSQREKNAEKAEESQERYSVSER